MGKDAGYIRLHRKVRENGLWRKPLHPAMAWIDILMEVRYDKTPCTAMLGMKMVECGHGESLNSIRTWADRWGWSESKTRRFLIMLQSERMIERESVGISTRIRVVNYERYNPTRMIDESEMNGKRMTDESEMNTEEERREEGKETHSALSEHEDYPTVLALWNEIKQRAHKPTNFEKLMVDALNDGCKVESFRTAFAAAALNEAAWQLQARVLKLECKGKRKAPPVVRHDSEGRV